MNSRTQEAADWNPKQNIINTAINA